MQSKHICVLLHSYNGKPSDLTSIEKFLESIYEKPKIIKPKIISNIFSSPDLPLLINRLLKEIDECWDQTKKELPSDIDPKVIFIGHSMGALIARKLYVCACGENSDVPLEAGINAGYIRPWAKHVDRIILMAGMNNGWKINTHLNFGKAVVMWLGTVFEPVLSIFGKPLILTLRRGGVLITQLRLQSIKMQNIADEKGVGKATVIQMLGTLDDLVSPEDNIDLISGNNFIYMEMPYSGHKNVIDLNAQKRVVDSNGTTTTVGKLRSARLLSALTEDTELLRANEITTAESNMIKRDNSVTDVVFVIHGIRDEGYWTYKVAQRVVKMARDKKSTTVDEQGNTIPRKFETETSSYGYFPLLHFALPRYRRAKVEWLMEQYSENMAKYPKAKFSYVGHSNGTYLLSKALVKYPACKFKNVLFAGSVVNHHYDWNEMINSNRVEKVYNIAASSDLVVGIFPHAFHYLGYKELGSAGYTGFKNSSSNQSLTAPGSLNQVVTVPGGHGAAVKEEYWDNIAHFILEGQLKTPITPTRRRVTINGVFAILLFLACIYLIYLGGKGIWIKSPDWHWRAAWLSVYGFVIWKILTRY